MFKKLLKFMLILWSTSILYSMENAYPHSNDNPSYPQKSLVHLSGSSIQIPQPDSHNIEWEAIEKAKKFCADGKEFEALSLLLGHPDLKNVAFDEYGNKFLHYAATYGCEKLLQELLKNSEYTEGTLRYAFEQAMRNGHKPCADILWPLAKSNQPEPSKETNSKKRKGNQHKKQGINNRNKNIEKGQTPVISSNSKFSYLSLRNLALATTSLLVLGILYKIVFYNKDKKNNLNRYN